MNTAKISEDQVYRYLLTRDIPRIVSDDSRPPRSCLFWMLNPSKADHRIDDPTIRRCKGFALRFGCDRLTVVNWFALRATNPRELIKHRDPIGPQNMAIVSEQLMAHRGQIIVAAWGSHPMATSRVDYHGDPNEFIGVSCLGMNGDGSPKHPLYLASDTPLQPWSPRASSARAI